MHRTRIATLAEGPAYQKAISSLERELNDLDGTRQDTVNANWAGLKEIGRR
jgi:hypothetical protein